MMMTDKNTSTHYLPEIDGLRAIAVLAVLLNHLHVPFFSGGYLGVDVFFVISGYLITSIIHREISSQSFSFAQFYERRARRILPALAILILACTLAGFILMLPNDFENFGQATFSASIFSSNVFFWLKTDYFSPTADSLPLLHLWSLGVEEQFYLLWPLALVFISTRKAQVLVVVLLLMSLIASELALSEGMTEDAFYLPHLRAWELLVGCAVALNVIPRFGTSQFIAKSCQLLAIILLVLPIAFYNEATRFPGVSALPVVIATAILIRASEASTPSLISRSLSHRIPQHIGRISYSLYLWHWPLIAFFIYTNNNLPNVLESIIIILVSFLLAELSYRYVEMPFRAPRNNITSSATKNNFIEFMNNNPLISSSGVLLMLALVGLILHFNHGFESRLTAKARFYNNAISYSSEINKKCLTSWKLIEPSNECLIGNKSSNFNKTLIWGDSHAAHLIPGFEVSLKKSDRVGITAVKFGCLPSLDFQIQRSRTAAIVGCDNFNQHVWKTLNGDHKFNQVIIAANWLGEFSNQKNIHAYTERYLKQTTDSLGSITQLLNAKGIDVVLVGQVPLPHREPTKCLAQSEMLSMPLARCSINDPDKRNLLTRLDTAFTQITSARQSNKILSLSEKLCTPNECKVLLNGKPVYRDDDHLTAEAAISVASDFVF